jgi:hypothetical protein
LATRWPIERGHNEKLNQIIIGITVFAFGKHEEKKKNDNMGLYEGIKDVAKIVQQADNLELYRQLIDLSAQALDMQAAINKLTEENAELKKKQDIEKRIQRHQELYLTLRGEEGDILYCSHCWDNDRKLIQMRKSYGECLCPHCQLVDYYDKTEYDKFNRRYYL